MDRSSTFFNDAFTSLNSSNRSAISHKKDMLYYTGYSGNLGGAYFWDNNTFVMPDYKIFTLRLDTLGNLLDLDTIPYNPDNGAEMNRLTMQLTSNSTMYLAGHHNYGIHFPDSSLYPLNGSGGNMRDIWIAKYGTDGPCFRCDSIRPEFTVEQYIGNTARVLANNTKYAEPGTYEWDFGHAGQTSTEELPTMTITYPDTGWYQVCLTAQNFCDSATACKQVYIGCPKPIVGGFAYTTGNNSIQIDSLALLQYDSYEWSFGDSTTSNDSLPFHQYANSGTYEVCLTAENSCGTEQYCETINITCPAPVISEWTYALDTFSLGITDAQLSNYDSLSWDFGDSSSSTELYPQHAYAGEGQYQVCLYAHNECGSTFACEQIDIIGTGILSLENGGSISVFPNPTSGQLNIRARNVKGSYNIAVINTSGQTLMEERFSGNGHRIDLQELSSGFYFLKLYNRKAEYTMGVVKE
jgi:PKD repeat protein